MHSFRNHIHHLYNLYSDFSIGSYREYVSSLKDIGASEIEHAGRALRYGSQRDRLKEVSSLLHDMDMKLILYTGIFGGENLSSNPLFESYTQRSSEGKILCYGNSQRQAMMCPSSPYVSTYLIPQVLDALSVGKIDGIFLDIPWIMRSGCYCSNCSDVKASGATNSAIVRKALEDFVGTIKSEFPSVSIGVNASAPGINNNSSSGGHIDNLSGIFDEYVTEWNPYRWNQKPEAVGRCIALAKEKVQGKLYHSTTLTKDNKLLEREKMKSLFSAIFGAGAIPRLSIGFSLDKVVMIGDELKAASDNAFS